MADFILTNPGLEVIRGIIVQDPVALKKWSAIKYDFVKKETHRREIEKCTDDEIKVLTTLEFWKSEVSSSASLQTLVNILRNRDLNALADKLAGEENQKHIKINATDPQLKPYAQVAREELQVTDAAGQQKYPHETFYTPVPAHAMMSPHAQAEDHSETKWNRTRWNIIVIVSFAEGLFLLTSSALFLHDWPRDASSPASTEEANWYRASAIICITVSSLQILAAPIFGYLRFWRLWCLLHIVIFVSVVAAVVLGLVHRAMDYYYISSSRSFTTVIALVTACTLEIAFCSLSVHATRIITRDRTSFE